MLIFVLYKKEASRIESLLTKRGFKCCAIHGDKSAGARAAALESFKVGNPPLMIATDVAARGLDIPKVEYVINYSFPLTVEDYVHRIGRTGRAGAPISQFLCFPCFFSRILMYGQERLEFLTLSSTSTTRAFLENLLEFSGQPKQTFLKSCWLLVLPQRRKSPSWERLIPILFLIESRLTVMMMIFKYIHPLLP